jgi:YteA family regulatory protein
MNRNETEHYRDLLLKMLDGVDNTIEMMKSNREAEQDNYTAGELSNYDNHPADLGTELFQLELNNALKVHEESILSDIKDALDRIDKGIYGVCAGCGKDIPAERLEVHPYAKMCITCQESFENSPLRKMKGRANEELVIDAPFGRKYLNKQEDDEYEGMDQLRDLMKYGSSDSPQDMGGYHDYEEYYTNKVDKQGIVDDMDQVTNEEYKKQLPT